MPAKQYQDARRAGRQYPAGLKAAALPCYNKEGQSWIRSSKRRAAGRFEKAGILRNIINAPSRITNHLQVDTH
jgi:hypothetical protein